MIDTTLDEVQNEVIEYVRDPDQTGAQSGSGPFAGHNFNNPLSGPSTFARALARAVYFYADESLRRILRAIHPHSAEERDLHEHLQRKGLEPWKVAIKARHNVRVGSSTAVEIALTVSQGQIVYAGAAKIPFRFLDAVSIPVGTVIDSRGSYTVAAMVECLYDGNIGNVAPDSITEFDSPLDGIDVLYNPDTVPDTEGRSRESIASVRSRLSLSETEGSETMWTPPWYILEALNFTYVARAVFVSAKKLGLEGEVKVLLLGTNGDLSATQLQEIEDHFAAEENDPGGAAHVIAENITTQEIDKNFVILFSAAEYLPTTEQIQNLIDEYFYSLTAGDDYTDAGIINKFNTMPGYVSTTIDIPGDVGIDDDVLAIPAAGFSVVAQVYVG